MPRHPSYATTTYLRFVRVAAVDHHSGGGAGANCPAAAEHAAATRL